MSVSPHMIILFSIVVKICITLTIRTLDHTIPPVMPLHMEIEFTIQALNAIMINVRNHLEKVHCPKWIHILFPKQQSREYNDGIQIFIYANFPPPWCSTL